MRAAELKQLAIRRNGPGLTRLFWHLLSLIATGTGLWLSLGHWLVFPLTLIHGYVLAFLFCAQHETAHRTAFRSRLLNDLTGHLAGFLLLLPQHSFRLFHWDHHRYTQNPQRDPELANGLPSSRAAVLWVWCGIPNWSNRIKTLIRHAVFGRVTSPWIADDKKAGVIREARVYLAGYLLLLIGSVAMQSTVLLWLWLLPLFCGYWFLRPYLLCEHTGCPHQGTMAEVTNTTFSNRLVHLYAWNMPYHTEHHVYPAIPFHALPALHRQMSDQLVNTQSGYLSGWRKVVRYLTTSGGPFNSTTLPSGSSK